MGAAGCWKQWQRSLQYTHLQEIHTPLQPCVLLLTLWAASLSEKRNCIWQITLWTIEVKWRNTQFVSSCLFSSMNYWEVALIEKSHVRHHSPLACMHLFPLGAWRNSKMAFPRLLCTFCLGLPPSDLILFLCSYLLMVPSDLVQLQIN